MLSGEKCFMPPPLHMYLAAHQAVKKSHDFITILTNMNCVRLDLSVCFMHSLFKVHKMSA